MQFVLDAPSIYCQLFGGGANYCQRVIEPYLSSFGIPPQEMKTQRLPKGKVQSPKYITFHFTYIRLCIGIVCYVHKVSHFRGKHFLIFGSQQHGGDTHQLEFVSGHRFLLQHNLHCILIIKSVPVFNSNFYGM